MKRKALTNIVSFIVGLLFGYSTFHMPIRPIEMYNTNRSAWWEYHIQNYGWLILLFFAIGYGLTFFVFWLFNRDK